MTRAPTCFANWRASTRLGETFFSRLPPPTERMRSVSGREARAAQPLDEHGGPALVVGAGGELGDVVGGRVALEPGDFAEVVHGVRGVGRAAADAEDEEAAAAVARGAQLGDAFLAVGGIELGDDLGGLRNRRCWMA
jgi:hypothetical protein